MRCLPLKRVNSSRIHISRLWFWARSACYSKVRQGNSYRRVREVVHDFASPASPEGSFPCRTDRAMFRRRARRARPYSRDAPRLVQPPAQTSSHAPGQSVPPDLDLPLYADGHLGMDGLAR